MKTTFTTLFFILSISLSFAQSNTAEIVGSVKEATGTAVPFANILLLHAKDSSLVKGSISQDNGSFNINAVKYGQYLIAVSMVGFTKKYTERFTLSGGENSLAIEPIILTPLSNQLKEVTVAVKKPFIEQAIDRTIVNVANSIIGSGGTALEVLEKSPGITVDYQAETLQMRGKEGVILQIDGKQSYLSAQDAIALLRSMPSDNIDRIELITNPSARYDAAGNSGIINIRLKKNNNIGTNGSVSLAAGSGFYARERGSFQLNHKTPKMNVFGSYSLTNGNNYSNFALTQTIVAPTTTEPTRRVFGDQYSPNKMHDLGQNAKVGFDYALSKKSNMGVSWTGFWTKHEENVAATAEFQHGKTAPAPIYLSTKTAKTLSKPVENHLVNLNVQHNFGEKQGQLSADFDLGRFNSDYANTLFTQTLIAKTTAGLPPEKLVNTMPVKIDILTAKADYTRPLNSIWKIETGIKTADIKTDNDLKIRTGAKDVLTIDPDLSNHFTYTERVNAVYVNFLGKIKAKTEVQIGLRAEQTHSVGKSSTLTEATDRNYLNVFPTLFVSQTIAKDKIVTFSYSYRIDRPNYKAINPGREYVDFYAYAVGVPTIRPQFTHALEVKYNVANKIYLSLAADYTKDYLKSINYVVNEFSTARVWLNSGSVQGYTLTSSFPLTVTKGWQMQTNLLGYYKQFQFTYENTPVSVQNLSARAAVNNGFVFGHGWTGELNGWVNTPRQVSVIGFAPWMGVVDAGIQKSVSSVLKLKLSVQDIFKTSIYRETLTTPNGSTVSAVFKGDTRIAMLTFNYAFGNQQLKAMRQRRAASEDETRRAN
jgi:hypothetical protein